jgi:succinoglycan biosynthesis transport protein ExoP
MMNMEDMTPRTRPLTGADYRDIWHRRKWWFLVAAFVVGVGTAIVAAILPNTYKSECLIIVEQPTVPEKYVKPVVDADMQQQLSTLAQEARSRTNLQQFLWEAGKYKHNEQIPDDVTDDVDSRVSVQIVKDNDPRQRLASPYALKVGFEDPSPVMAQRMTNVISAFFVAQKLKRQEAGADDAVNLLRSQVQAANQNLQSIEAKLVDMQRKYPGQLPMDEQLNLQTLTRLQSALQSNQQALDRAQQDLDTALNPPATDNSSGGTSSTTQVTPTSLAGQLQILKAKLVDLQSRYTPNHPDVIKTKDEIAGLEHTIQQQNAQASVKATSTSDMSATTLARIQSAKAEIATRTAQQAKLQKAVETYEANLQAIPVHTQEYNDLHRAYESAKVNYDTLRDKLRDTEIGADLEKKQEGQRLRIQDFASLPDTPEKPLRWRINLVGLAAGLLLGVVLAGGAEMTDSSLKSEADAEFYSGFKNLAVVPLLLTDEETRRQRVRRSLILVSCLAASLVAAGILYYLYLVRM